MRPILLVAGGLVRQQRWYVVLLLGWVGASAVIFASPRGSSPEDLMFFLHQQAVYGGALTVFLTCGALHNERRSRRILGVLSKAVTRAQYLCGLFVGSLAISAMYCVATAIASAAMAPSVAFTPEFA